MKPKYEDIRKKIKEYPKWFDEHGVPRYEKFNPELASNIYASQVALIKIKCQNCNEEFFVELNSESYDKFDLKRQIDCYGILSYGDPPIHDCVGDTMGSISIKIIEFWEKRDFDFVRLKEFEREGKE